MIKEKTIRDLKVGDTVFVVHQRRRGDKEFRTAEMQIVKVGNKYAYLQGTWAELSFHRDSGISNHPKDCNARNNGYGFNVYLCREDWEREESHKAEKYRLEKRLISTWNRLRDLPPSVVSSIHSILDEADWH